MGKLYRLAIGSTPGMSWAVILLIRVHVGLIFLLAGLRKFLEPDDMGGGRFEEMSMPAPWFMGYWVGSWELIGGVLVLIGLLTRAGAVPLVATMLFALWLTKVPNFAEDPLVEALHAMRLDFALLMSALFLMFAGSGRFAVDRVLSRRDDRTAITEPNTHTG